MHNKKKNLVGCFLFIDWPKFVALSPMHVFTYYSPFILFFPVPLLLFPF